MKFLRISIRIVVIFIIAAFAAIFICNKIINNYAEDKMYNDVNKIPYNKTGILLGTSKYLQNGYINYYYKYRIDAATELMKAGKIKYIIVSGDNGRHTYNEPDEMRKDLIANGIDSNKIYCDYAGFRTFDSMVRLKEIFSQDSVTIISQPFHNARALYIAKQQGIAAIAFNAKDVNADAGFKTNTREKFARVKLFVDNVINTKPKFLGKKVIIPE